MFVVVAAVASFKSPPTMNEGTGELNLPSYWEDISLFKLVSIVGMVQVVEIRALMIKT